MTVKMKLFCERFCKKKMGRPTKYLMTRYERIQTEKTAKAAFKKLAALFNSNGGVATLNHPCRASIGPRGKFVVIGEKQSVSDL